jgi:uncharacterized membrane protein YidH (DUF202 family)
MRRGQPLCVLLGASIAEDLGVTARYLVGSLLIVIGLVSLLLGGFRWTQQKTVVDIGPLKATTEEHKTVPIPPVIGGLALVGGILVLVVPTMRRA